jgi:ribosomal protein S26
VDEMRGKETLVICDSCGRKVPRNKAVSFDKSVSFNTELKTGNDVRYFGKRKVYYCISCAKHRKIFEKKKRIAMRQSSKNENTFD